MPAGGGDLERAPRDRLAAHVGEVAGLARAGAGAGRSGSAGNRIALPRGGPRPRRATRPGRRRGPRRTRLPRRWRPGRRLRRSRPPGRRARGQRAPRTGRACPERPSSPRKTRRRPPRGRMPPIWQRATATGRSSAAPAFRHSAGARLTVTAPEGNGKPPFFRAARTRSRASRTVVSGRPTIVKRRKSASRRRPRRRARGRRDRRERRNGLGRASILLGCEETPGRATRTGEAYLALGGITSRSPGLIFSGEERSLAAMIESTVVPVRRAIE